MEGGGGGGGGGERAGKLRGKAPSPKSIPCQLKLLSENHFSHLAKTTQGM